MTTDLDLLIQHDVYGISVSELATRFDFEPDSIRGRLSRARTPENSAEVLRLQGAKAIAYSDDQAAQHAIINRANEKFNSLKREDEWKAQNVKILWLGDIHFPFQYQPAMNLAYQIAEAVQPRYITALNDLFDFDMYGRWTKNPNPATFLWQSSIDNVLRMAETHHKTLQKAVSGVSLLGLAGNHDKRIFAFLRASQGGFAEKNIAYFMSQLENQGVLQFTNSGMAENVLHMSPGLKLVHGVSDNASNASVGKAVIKRMAGTRMNGDAGILYNTASGHVHRSFDYSEYGIQHTNFGCLCKINPGYMAHTADWQPGIGVIEYEPNGRTVNTTRIDFYRVGDELRARYGEREFKSPL